MTAIIIFCIAFAIVLFIVTYGIIADDKTSQLNLTDEDLNHITFSGVGRIRMDWNHLVSRPAVKKQVEAALKCSKESEEK